MDYTNAGLLPFSVLVLLCSMVVGQQTTNNSDIVLGFMPGSSPASPNKALKLCLTEARPRPLNVSYAGMISRNINNWCGIYSDVLPCLDRKLPPSKDVTDWFLKLILDQSRASRMSRSICARFPYIANLTCADEGMERARQCMEWSTKTSITQFYSQFRPDQPFTDINKRMASIYACITTVATAGCLHKHLTRCTVPQRKLIYDYYIMFSGKCREIAGLQEVTATSTMKPNVTDSIQEEDTKLNTALTSELDKKNSSEGIQNIAELQRDNEENATYGRELVNKQQGTGGENGQKSFYRDTSVYIVCLFAAMSLL